MVTPRQRRRFNTAAVLKPLGPASLIFSTQVRFSLLQFVLTQSRPIVVHSLVTTIIVVYTPPPEFRDQGVVMDFGDTVVGMWG